MKRTCLLIKFSHVYWENTPLPVAFRRSKTPGRGVFSKLFGCISSDRKLSSKPFLVVKLRDCFILSGLKKIIKDRLFRIGIS